MPEFQDVALAFATALADHHFAAAHAMICESQQSALAETALRTSFDAMISHRPITSIDVIETMTDWPTKHPRDAGWAYVAISGETFSEAVTVVITEEKGKLAVRTIEWGRP